MKITLAEGDSFKTLSGIVLHYWAITWESVLKGGGIYLISDG